jgi:glycosyltransferase involved in cell wall biosynthesis
MPAVRAEFNIVDMGNRSGWVVNAANALSARQDIELGIVWASSLVREYKRFSDGNITYFCVPRGGWMEAVGDRLRGAPVLRNLWQILTYIPRERIRGPLRACRRIVDEFQPDLIHVHGTEGFYGLLGDQTDNPVVISLQGILSEVVKVYWGSVPWWRRPFFPREMLLYSRMRRNAVRETRIMRRNRYFTGRTHWDEETLLRLNPAATFFSDGARLLRPEFHGSEWSLENSTRFRLYTTVTSRPYKGTDTLIEAIGLIRQKYPSATLRIGGHLPDQGYGAYVRRRIHELELTSGVELIGFVEAKDIVAELQGAHAYILGSHIENSPNTVAEAQAIGTPCIATSAGGTPSMVTDGVSGLLYQAGDAQALVECIDRMFSDDGLACALSSAERTLARQRVDETSNADRLLDIYAQVLSEHAA